MKTVVWSLNSLHCSENKVTEYDDPQKQNPLPLVIKSLLFVSIQKVQQTAWRTPTDNFFFLWIQQEDNWTKNSRAKYGVTYP